ncbi:MAG: hypothetical protein EOO11_11210 [Chitinophagaceae bacterium]|nr:MAG: hypothetical protein EOO11_11210 [Chitinophagaceae bacterium]
MRGREQQRGQQARAAHRQQHVRRREIARREEALQAGIGKRKKEQLADRHEVAVAEQQPPAQQV